MKNNDSPKVLFLQATQSHKHTQKRERERILATKWKQKIY